MIMLQKNKKKVLSGLIIFIFLLSGLSYYFSSIYPKQVLDKKYQTGIMLIKQNSWTEARQLLETLPTYKDSFALQKYTYAEDIITKYKTPFDKDALSAIQSIPEDYNGQFTSDIKTFKEYLLKQKQDLDNKMEVIAKEQSIKDQQEKQEFVNVFHQSKYENATILAVLKRNDNEWNILYEYACAFESNQKGDHDMMIYYLAEIDDTKYNGIMASEIKQTLEKYSSEIAKEKKIQAQVAQQQNKPNLEIGMSADEVLQSSWGKPDKVNKTITSTMTHEQWVYDNNYVYLDNGKVTAIQQN